MSLPKTRGEARLSGCAHYFTGKPCRHGHLAPRFVSTGGCVSCQTLFARSRYVHQTEKRRQYTGGEEFVRLVSAENQHLDYSRVQYVNAHTKVEIICPDHGSFWQSPTNHIQGKSCPVCGSARMGKKSRSSTAGFIARAKKVWGDTFDYSQVEYVKAHQKVSIICPDHGPFLQTPTNHLDGKQACAKCSHMKSAPEDALADFLERFTPVARRDRNIIGPKELDIYLPKHNLAVEFCGMYWHSHGDREDEKKNKYRHAEKHRLCAEKGIRLITLYETEWQERPQVIKRMLRNAIGRARGRVMARKCQVGRPTPQEARAFYERYHPQGGAGHGEHYGLYYKGKLVACMRFNYGSNDRGAAAKERQWTLGRYATRITVPGGASRLFKAFLQDMAPPSVKSFSDNRWFSGDTYPALGFALEEDVLPDYQVWSPKIGLRPKPHYQRRVLPKRLEEHGLSESFDPKADPRTEAEMTYLMGARRIYDCGKKRWVWTAAPEPDNLPARQNPSRADRTPT